MAQPTLHDVAARAGVSIKTVSNVLRGVENRVSVRTAARVHQVIEEIGYRPNLSARRLRTGHSQVIALAVPDLGNPYFAEVATAMIGAARKAGYTLLIEETGGEAGAELGAAEHLRDPLIEGVIMSPLALAGEALAQRTRSMPIVLLGEHEPDATFGHVMVDHVAIDNAAASRALTGHLLDQGFRRIAVIGRQDHAPHATATALQRLKGYREALSERGLAFDEALAPAVPGAHYSKEAGARAAARIFTQGERPEALYCFADVLAIGALRAAHDHGLHAPHDFALAGFDGIDEGRFTIPTLTTVRPDYADMARQAVSALVERMTSESPAPPRDLRCGWELIVRESTGAARTSG
ncbi:LacI family DNA-binding transcriptional regulator [Streptomyces sp. ME19-01-6]|uniref:LacI family DNA-binding transcriptional regulator n=1 Tax=Streptomyces sp. ME19-01-6 TaxID=3028686 RepID=UPI0029A1AEE6|nr:LacI family DNA-binding transcriptional regulator [Streptomyces sp. ME19-01-6]MDX3231875.1 LacI family DNA-binding transcriptional regulator [Streptomyces sp. ME19-01-6]